MGTPDSTFVHLGSDIRLEQADEIGQRLAKMINDNWAALMGGSSTCRAIWRSSTRPTTAVS